MVWCGVLFGALLLAEPEAVLRGRVTNENHAPVAGARVLVQETAASMRTDLNGNFLLRLPKAGLYHVDIEREGYFRLEKQAVELGAGTVEAVFVLNQMREVFESLEVRATGAAVDMDSTTARRTVHGTDILAVPYPTTNNLKNALRIIPGVVQDSRGGIHLNGGSEEQVLYTLNGFTANDPLSGRFESRVSVESVQEVETSSGRMPAEFGKGSAGMLAVRTASGEDRLRYNATNFFPGIESRKGLYIGNWTPRAGLSGPIRKGRAWFSNTADAQYVKTIVEELPKGEDRNASWRFSNLLTSQVNLSPSHILSGGWLVNGWTAPRAGLTALDPLETTTDRRTRQWFAHLKDQVYFGRGALLEAGFAINRTFGREIPQGEGLTRFTPFGKRGYNYLDAVRKGRRTQWLVNLFLPAVAAGGEHRFKVGVDLDQVGYWQDVRRTGYEHTRLDDSTKIRVVFEGCGRLERSNFEAGYYLQDSWKPRPGLLVETGVRSDSDRLLRIRSYSPRLGVAWAPELLKGAKLSAGFGAIHDATSLRLFTRQLDQISLATYYEPDGAVTRGPAVSVFTIGGHRLLRPVYRNWSLSLERELPGNAYGRFNWLRRRGNRGLTYVNLLGSGDPPPAGFAEYYRTSAFDAVYDLLNQRRDVFDAYEFSFRQSLRGQYEWLIGYVRSAALSNAVVDISVDEPFLVSNNVGRMPWDSPNRLISWGYLPTFWPNWAVAYLLEARDGFPYSLLNEGGQITQVSARRYPSFFELNLHLERRLTFLGHRWAFRAGFNNLTGRYNPNGVNNNPESPNYLAMYGGQGRALNFRIRWLGRKR